MWDYINIDICVYVDDCKCLFFIYDYVRRYFINNFKNLYEGNKVLFGFYFYGRWFYESRNYMGFKGFLDYL